MSTLMPRLTSFVGRSPPQVKGARSEVQRSELEHAPWPSSLKTSSRLSSSPSFFPRRRFFPPC
jgi:hypothetical protein